MIAEFQGVRQSAAGGVTEMRKIVIRLFALRTSGRGSNESYLLWEDVGLSDCDHTHRRVADNVAARSIGPGPVRTPLPIAQYYIQLALLPPRACPPGVGFVRVP